MRNNNGLSKFWKQNCKLTTMLSEWVYRFLIDTIYTILFHYKLWLRAHYMPAYFVISVLRMYNVALCDLQFVFHKKIQSNCLYQHLPQNYLQPSKIKMFVTFYSFWLANNLINNYKKIKNKKITNNHSKYVTKTQL